MTKQVGINMNQNWKDLMTLLDQTRIEKGITQEELGARTGKSQAQISWIFKMQNVPSLELFLQLANAVGLEFGLNEKTLNKVKD